MLTEKAEGRIAMLIVDKLAFQEKLSEGEKTLLLQNLYLVLQFLLLDFHHIDCLIYI